MEQAKEPCKRDKQGFMGCFECELEDCVKPKIYKGELKIAERCAMLDNSAKLGGFVEKSY